MSVFIYYVVRFWLEIQLIDLSFFVVSAQDPIPFLVGGVLSIGLLIFFMTFQKE